MSSDVAKEKEMLKLDHYSLLGIDKTATDKEIKKAYRTKARDVHPDKNPNDEKAAGLFHKLNEAYEFMLDPAKRAKYDLHREHNVRQEEKRQKLDSVLRKRRDDLEARENAAESNAQSLARKMANRKEEIKRLRAEGDRLLEEEQSKFRIAKKSQDEYARIKLSWDASAKTYSAKELKNVLGASAVVLSSKKEGRAIAEFDTAQMAIAAEFAAKRLYSCPVKIEWLTKPPSNYKLSKATANPTYTSSQNVHFEEFQENVLSRCEKC